MRRPKLLQTDQSYSFGSYFEMPYEVDDLLAEFGDGFEATRLRWPWGEHPSLDTTPSGFACHPSGGGEWEWIHSHSPEGCPAGAGW